MRKRQEISKVRGMTGQQIVQLPVVLFILFVIVLPVLLAFASLAWGACTLMLAADSAARAAATSTSYMPVQSTTPGIPSIPGALQKADQVASGIVSGMQGLCVLTPNPGISLAVNKVDASGNVSAYAPGAAAPDPSTDSSDYQYVVTAQYNALPVLNFANGGFLQGIPFLGAPVPFQFSSSSHIERIEGLHSP